MTADVNGGTAIIRDDSGQKMAVVNLFRQTVELKSRVGGRHHSATIPIGSLVELVDPEGTTYRKTTGVNF